MECRRYNVRNALGAASALGRQIVFADVDAYTIREAAWHAECAAMKVVIGALV